MAQSINVDMTPGLFMPTLHYSQGDVGREFVINLSTRDGMTIPAGATVTMQATKPSGFGFSVTGTLSGTVATFTTTDTMTDEYGRFQAEIVIAQGTTVIGTTNFWLEGEKNPHPEGTIDGSQGTIIPELTLLVERVETAASSILDMDVVATTLAAGSQATYSYDEDTNTATFGIPQGEAGAGSAGVVASAYSSSSTYAVGDYVIHNSNLYRCTTAITTAEAFTAAHWTQVVLADDVSDLSSAFNNTLYNDDDSLSKWEQGSYDTTNGSAYSTNTNIRNTSFVGLTTGHYRITAETGYRFLLYAWDSTNTYLGAVKTDMTINKVVSNWKHFTDFDLGKFPTYKFRIALLKTDNSAILPSEGEKCHVFCGSKKHINEVENNIKILNDEVFEKIGTDIALTVSQADRAQSDAGYPITFTGYNLSDFIAVPSDADVLATNFSSAPKFLNLSYNAYAMEFYSAASNGSLITANAIVATVESEKVYKIPSGTNYVRLTIPDSSKSIAFFRSRVGSDSENIDKINALLDSQFPLLPKEIKAGNMIEAVLPSSVQTIGSTVIEPTEYSGLHISGSVANGSTNGITQYGIALDSNKKYTMIAVTENDDSISPIVLGMIALNSGDVKDNAGTNVFVRLGSTNKVVFTPYENYTNVALKLWQGSGESISINSEVFVYLVEGEYNESDFVVKQAELGINPYDFRRTQVFGDLYVGLPILDLVGDTYGMTKENEVTLNWKYGNDSGTCTMKWQGASSLNYSKKNYTIKFDKNVDVGWGGQKKYCLKANYIDNTSALNICSAKLWSRIVANRGVNPAIDVAANNGAMDGFPIIIMLNGLFHGLYTMNTPKDKWAFGMGSNILEYLVTAENHSTSTKFKGTTDLDGTDMELEYADDSVELNTVKTSVNNMINAIIGATGSNWESAVSPYMDIDTAIDYMIFSALIANIDGVDKNFILSTYDGTKWFLNAYDLDSVLGNDWNGGSYYPTNPSGTSFAGMNSTSRLFHLIYTYSRQTMIDRYDYLRNGILSEDSVHDLFYNFCAPIPEPIVTADNNKWVLKPATSTKTLSRIMEWYRLHLKKMDAEVDALR